jgi:hypothetical protein
MPSACVTGSLYALSAQGVVSTLDTAFGQRQELSAIPGPGGVNALAVTADGRAIYAAQQSGSGSSTLYRVNAATGTSTVLPGPTVAGAYDFVMGAIDPVSGLYYLGSPTADGIDIFAFDTRTDTAIAGRVATIARPNSSGSGSSGGDMVFDASGRLYIVLSQGTGRPGSNQLVRVDAPLPTTGADLRLTGTKLADLLPDGASFSGVAFDGDGYLYLSSGTELVTLNPNTGAVLAKVDVAPTGGVVDDLADCQYNGRLTLRANIAARVATSDQFALSITGGGVTAGNSATTAGSDPGLQGALATAGPVIGLAGTTYQIHQQAAPGSLADYVVTAVCLDSENAGAELPLTPLTTGATSDYSFVFPTSSGAQSAAVECTFTDTPRRPPSPSYTVAAAINAESATPGSLLTYTLTVTNTGEVAYLGGAARARADLSGLRDDATIVRGSATASAGTVQLTDAVVSWAGPLTAGAGPGSIAVITFQVRVDAPDIGDSRLTTAVTASGDGGRCDRSCGTNTPIQQFSVTGSGEGGSPDPGRDYTYVITVTNTGQVAYPDSGAGAAAFSDDLSGVLDDARLVPGSVTASVGTAQLHGAELSWSGPLAIGAIATVTYRVRLDDAAAGDGVLTNRVSAAGPGADANDAGLSVAIIETRGAGSSIAAATSGSGPGGSRSPTGVAATTLAQTGTDLRDLTAVALLLALVGAGLVLAALRGSRRPRERPLRGCSQSQR